MNAERRTFPPPLAIVIVVVGLLPLWLDRSFLAPAADSAALEHLRVCPLGLSEQWVVVLTAFVVKPAYMILSLALIIWLWRSGAADLTALRRGLVAFLAGESACAVNYVFLGGRSELWEYLHSYGMVVGFSFVSYALLEGMDQRLIRYSAARDRCAALSLCRACLKYADVPCGLRRLFLFVIPATALLAVLPLTADFRPAVYRSDVLGASVGYSHTLASQWFETRLCPAFALGAFAVSWLVLRFKQDDPVRWSKLLFAAGLGPLGFGLLRTLLVATFREDLMWFETWEEWTELLFVLGVACVLAIFRTGLLRDRSETPAGPGMREAGA